MTTLRALNLAAAALRDCRRVYLSMANTDSARELHEAHDLILHLAAQQPNAVIVGDDVRSRVPHETNGGTSLSAKHASDSQFTSGSPTSVPVLTMAQVSNLQS
jgi:hypothetical protein